ncbi:MAG: hypothetical protein AAGI49_06865 [Bacteroidota bacterium]
MKYLISILLLLLTFCVSISAQNVMQSNANTIIGEWRGTLLLNGDYLHQCMLEILCHEGDYVEGKLHTQGPDYLNYYTCGFRFSGEISTTMYEEGALSINTYDMKGGGFCGSFNGNLQLVVYNNTLNGMFTRSGFRMNVQKDRDFYENKCNTKRTTITNSPPTKNPSPTSVDKPCSCCSGGSSQNCAACEGTGTVTETIYTNGNYQTITRQCGGIGCNNGRMTCYCCNGSGRSKY